MSCVEIVWKSFEIWKICPMYDVVVTWKVYSVAEKIDSSVGRLTKMANMENGNV